MLFLIILFLKEPRYLYIVKVSVKRCQLFFDVLRKENISKFEGGISRKETLKESTKMPF